MTQPDLPTLFVDGSGLLCVQLLLQLRTQIADLTPGIIVEVITTDPAAPLDLPAWCHLTGHRYLGTVSGAEPPTHRIQIAADPRRTTAERPWHSAEVAAPAPGAIAPGARAAQAASGAATLA